MKAMVLKRLSDLDSDSAPLELSTLPCPSPGQNDILVRVTACGVCHTEIDEIEGRTPPPELPVVPGHEVIGVVEKVGSAVSAHKPGDRIGVGWIYSACGKCSFCREGKENLCADFRATGRDANGGYAEHMKIGERFAFSIPATLTDLEAAPLLCAGAIGYRSLRLASIGNGDRLGLTGFGSSAHLVLKMAKHMYPDTEIYVFARSPRERDFARELGAVWAGDTGDRSPRKLRSIIDTTPVWKPVVEALRNLEAGGRLVINAIRKQDTDKDYLLNLDYARDLWCEKEIKSVANVTRADIAGMIRLAAEVPLKPEVQEFALEEANEALLELKNSKIRGAKVLRI
jgi:propanol-preferring alcohol dehydrogenase